MDRSSHHETQQPPATQGSRPARLPHSERRRVGILLAILATLVAAGCNGGPTDPNDLFAHVFTENISAGASRHIVTFSSPNDLTRVRAFIDVDWGAAANNVTVDIYRLGDTDSQFRDCTAATQCPRVGGDVSATKPKHLDLTLDNGKYGLVVTNMGPGDEVVRVELRHVNPDER